MTLFAFCVNNNVGRLSIVDVSDLDNPVIVSIIGSVDDASIGSLVDIQVVGTTAYLLSFSTDSLIVVDISNTARPQMARR